MRCNEKGQGGSRSGSPAPHFTRGGDWRVARGPGSESGPRSTALSEWVCFNAAGIYRQLVRDCWQRSASRWTLHGPSHRTSTIDQRPYTISTTRIELTRQDSILHWQFFACPIKIVRNMVGCGQKRVGIRIGIRWVGLSEWVCTAGRK